MAKEYKAVAMTGADGGAILRAADCFGRAMVNDPTLVWLTNGKRPDVVVHIFIKMARMILYALPDYGDCWQLLPDVPPAATAAPVTVCIACEYPACYPGTWRLLVCGLLRVLAGMPSLHAVRVMMRTMDEFDRAKEAFHKANGPFLYIACYGTAPEHQGQGMGSQLMGAVLAAADKRGIPAYLEANSADSCRFYGRHGFQVLREIRAEKEAPPLIAMARFSADAPQGSTGSKAA